MSVQPRVAAPPLRPLAEAAVSPATANARRRAWTYLWTAFIVWLVLVGSGLQAGNTWRKTAYARPPAQLIAKQGIVLYQGPRDALPVSIAERTDLEEGSVLELPASSEATIQLGVDKSTIRLRSSTRLRLAIMRVGRFNRELTKVRIEQLQGAALYTVAGELPDGRELEVKTPHTPEPQDDVKLTKGEYLVWVQPNATRLISYQGQAKAELAGAVHRLRSGRWIAFGPERPEIKQPLELPEQLLKNRDFSRGLGESWSPIDIGEKGRPDVGGQRMVVEEPINGKPTRTLRVIRDTAKDTHNETGIRQDVERDVSAYRKVTFSAFVKVAHASLDGGGYAGSEYPMMFRIKYVAENGGLYTWVRGFYVKNEANRPAEVGEQIPAHEWYRFSLDLTGLPDRPAYIATVEAFASGHDYDAQVANVELVVE